ncbi:hypothetical protein HPT27_10015 [Permianibacter sp. IMCC34836]|uniref:M36 family metallopeptidase n=1 Tax=Permianibacter fluminis TaxID=2738515 RepID=UPI001556DF2B|nr:hypothetical protein [Permianibacter fluminis]
MSKAVAAKQGSIARRAAGALTIALALTSAIAASELSAEPIQTLHRDPVTGEPRFIRLHAEPLPGIGVLRAGEREHAIRQRIAELYALPSGSQDSLTLKGAINQRDGHQLYVFDQRFNGLPILDSRISVLLDGAARLQAISGEISKQTTAVAHSKSETRAAAQLKQALAALGITREVEKTGQDSDGAWHYRAAAPDRAEKSVDEVRANAVYVRQQQQLLPAWRYEITVSTGNRSTLWELVVSETGTVLRQRSLTHDASFQYRVYADASGNFQPFDSPHGDQTPHPTGSAEPPLNPSVVSANLVSLQNAPFSRNDPWLPANATVLRGNNADVYLDKDGINGFSGSDRRVSLSGAGTFDYSFDPNQNVNSNASNQNAAMLQAFYTVNWLHDLFYDAGFNEAAGNGQTSNYSRGGMANDALLLEIQDTEDRNNANMSVPGDGNPPRMQVFIFDGATTHKLTLSGGLTADYDTGSAAFGDQNFDVTGDIVVWNDGVVGSDTDPNTNDADASVFDGCEAHPTPAQITGKIALINRGWCKFQEKAANAQQAGAIGVIIANHLDNSTVAMASIAGGPAVTIGALSIGKADGDALRSALGGAAVSGHMQRTTGPDIDGALDSTLVAHEWGHYLNNRLMNISSQQSQGMDEGWSDFVALVALSRDGDDPDGVYAFSGYVSSDHFHGLRRFPYSTDMSKNGLTFKHIADGVLLPDGRSGATNSEVHATGEVWASMLWEGYSSLLANYPAAEAKTRMLDIIVRAQLLMPSDPDFVEARDAVIAAITDPADQLRFWQGFSKRGLGVGAQAPSKSVDAQTGGSESFVTPLPPTANAGADQTVTEGNSVSLSGSGSDGDSAILSYRWTQLSGPAASLSNGGMGATTRFTAPSISSNATLTFQLTVTDNTGLTATDVVVITEQDNPNASSGGGGGGGGGTSSLLLAGLLSLLAGWRKQK